MVDLAWFGILSDLFINLAAGWFGAAFIVPATAKPSRRVSLWFLTSNMVFSTLFLVLAFKLRKLGGL